MSKFYTVVFNEGACGTFLVWFIGQHSNFIKLECEYLHEYIDYDDPTNLVSRKIKNEKSHLSISNYNDSFKFTVDSMGQFLIRSKFPASLEKNFIFKITPHSPQNLTSGKIFKFLPEINIILLTNEKYKWINSRLESFGKKPRHNDQRLILNNNQFHELQEYFTNKKISHCSISIDKILNLDVDEYNRLLQFTGSSPIDNWQELIVEYKNRTGIQKIF